MPPAHRFRTVGIYVPPPDEGQEHFYDFFKACGYDDLEFCESGFAHRPDTLPAYYQNLAKSVAAAKKRGFGVWILLLAGMKQWKGPEPYGGAGTFSALETELLEERLSYLRQAVRAAVPGMPLAMGLESGRERRFGDGRRPAEVAMLRDGRFSPRCRQFRGVSVGQPTGSAHEAEQDRGHDAVWCEMHAGAVSHRPCHLRAVDNGENRVAFSEPIADG